ncbi:agmatinase [uncultured Ruminococcus sp.]|uniref:agmatinase n=1 Tax=uncultured Ruminococcus sp. TaxID=165186 RepID=UPI0025CC39FA|nr:agmatinase [uncultured Ruminococcus sp.]
MTTLKSDKKIMLTYGGLESSKDTVGTDFAIVGIPFDIRTTYRPGTRFGPDAIRRAFGKDSFNEAVGIDTAAYVKGVDYGDLFMRNPENAYLGPITDEMREIIKTGTVPIVLGGDHSITFPELLAYKDVYGPVSIIHFDSHTDTWGSDTDKEHHDHSTPFRRAVEYGCIDPKSSIQVGMRGGLSDRSDFDFADNAGLTHISAIDIHHIGIEKTAELIREKVGNNKVMVTFDIDFVDPAYAPGTGTPVPCGFSSREALELVRHALIGLDIVGFDLVEVAPNYDAGEITAILAGRLVHEFITCLACRKAGITEYGKKGMNENV